jgi:hypothetical protein
MAGTGTMSLRYADRMHQDGSACVDLVDGFIRSVGVGWRCAGLSSVWRAGQGIAFELPVAARWGVAAPS